eukprot:866520-Alexandrium_andersonii.AAC.1
MRGPGRLPERLRHGQLRGDAPLKLHGVRPGVHDQAEVAPQLEPAEPVEVAEDGSGQRCVAADAGVE